VITTRRLTIRELTLDDLGELQTFLSDPQTLDFWERPYTAEDSKRRGRSSASAA